MKQIILDNGALNKFDWNKKEKVGKWFDWKLPKDQSFNTALKNYNKLLTDSGLKPFKKAQEYIDKGNTNGLRKHAYSIAKEYPELSKALLRLLPYV